MVSTYSIVVPLRIGSGRRFVDRQVKGPFRLWEHTHAFEERPDGTLIRDAVLYRMPYGPLGDRAPRPRRP